MSRWFLFPTAYAGIHPTLYLFGFRANALNSHSPLLRLGSGLKWAFFLLTFRDLRGVRGPPAASEGPPNPFRACFFGAGPAGGFRRPAGAPPGALGGLRGPPRACGGCPGRILGPGSLEKGGYGLSRPGWEFRVQGSRQAYPLSHRSVSPNCPSASLIGSSSSDIFLRYPNVAQTLSRLYIPNPRAAKCFWDLELWLAPCAVHNEENVVVR